MTTIPPTAAPQILAAAVAAAGPVVVVQQPPPDMAKLPPGATVEAVVVRVQQQQQQQAAEIAAAAADQAAETRPAVTLRTSSGDVVVRTAVPLDTGAKVALEILRSAPNQVTARVVTIDGQPPQQALAQTAKDAAPQTTPLPTLEKLAPLPNPTQTAPLQPGQAWTPAGPAPLVTLNPMSAFVLKGPITPGLQLPAVQTPATPLNAAQIFQPGADLGIRIVSMQTAPLSSGNLNPILGPQAPLGPGGGVVNPTLSTTPAPGAPIPPQVQTAQSNAIAGAPQPGQMAATPQAIATPGQTTPLPGQALATPTPQMPGPTPQTALTPVLIQSTETQGVKIATAQGLGAPTPAPPATVDTTAALVRLTGQVTRTSGNGAVVVQTPAGEIQLNARANVPVGSTLTFEVLNTLPPRADATGGITLAGPAPSPAGLPLTTPAMGWSSLSEALQLLQRVDPQAATQLAAAIPDGGPRTAAAGIAFVQAMRSGDARQWPGDTALRGLERAGSRGAQLAAQISGEVREMAARTTDTSADWRTLPMPWNAGDQIERIALILRREGTGDEDDAKKKGGKGKGTRFLVNLDLSRLGEMQLDGMFVKSTRAFDMMIRTKEQLPEDIRRDLAGLFANSNAAMGLKGALSFQIVKKFPDPTNAGGPPDRGGMWA